MTKVSFPFGITASEAGVDGVGVADADGVTGELAEGLGFGATTVVLEFVMTT